MERGVLSNEFLGLCETEKIAQGNEMPGDGAALQFLEIEARQKIDEVVAADGFEAKFALLGELIEFEEVASVSGDGIGGQPLFDANMSEEGGDRGSNFHQEPASSSAVSRLTAMPYTSSISGQRKSQVRPM